MKWRKMWGFWLYRGVRRSDRDAWEAGRLTGLGNTLYDQGDRLGAAVAYRRAARLASPPLKPALELLSPLDLHRDRCNGGGLLFATRRLWYFPTETAQFRILAVAVASAAKDILARGGRRRPAPPPVVPAENRDGAAGNG